MLTTVKVMSRVEKLVENGWFLGWGLLGKDGILPHFTLRVSVGFQPDDWIFWVLPLRDFASDEDKRFLFVFKCMFIVDFTGIDRIKSVWASPCCHLSVSKHPAPPLQLGFRRARWCRRLDFLSLIELSWETVSFFQNQWTLRNLFAQ